VGSEMCIRDSKDAAGQLAKVGTHPAPGRRSTPRRVSMSLCDTCSAAAMTLDRELRRPLAAAEVRELPAAMRHPVPARRTVRLVPGVRHGASLGGVTTWPLERKPPVNP